MQKYKVDVPTGLLDHTLNQLNRDESARLVSTQQGSSEPISSDSPTKQDPYSAFSYSLNASYDRANRGDNRWGNIFSYDHSLLPGQYLNASLIPPYPYEGSPLRRSYIASQAPLPHTLPTFYQNIIDQKVALVVNLTALNDRGQVKSDEYWPMKKGQKWKSTPGYVVEHRKDPIARSEVIKTIHYQLRLIEEKDGGNKGREHDFDLLHITSWPDFGSFSDFTFANLLKLIDESAKGTKEPMWVHCSAGIGRSGTVIASLLARDLGSSSLSKALNLAPMTTPSLLADGALKGAKSMVDHERRYRPKMVQTADQLGMVVSAIGDVLQAVE